MFLCTAITEAIRSPLTHALWIPLGAALLLFMFGRKLSPAACKTLASCGFVAPLIAALAAFVRFPAELDAMTGYAFHTELPARLDRLGIALTLGLDGVSLPMFLLAALVGAAAGLQALGSDVEEKPLYFALLLVMLGGALGMFASVDVFFFYFFHEFSLIPTFILILRWGGIGRRTAAIQMAIYLTIGAMISLAGLILLYLKSGAGSFDLIALRTALAAKPLDGTVAGVVGGLLLFGFGILVSLFPFHSWAPACYTEAPTPVSMLHAGVLKKFGLYGLIQTGALLVPDALSRWASVLFWLALGNILLIGLATIGQRHLKEMLSYSSVMHMGPCFLGIFAFALAGGPANTGIGSAVMLMFAHGLSVAALFSLCHSIQTRTGTLEFSENGGLAKRAPVLAAFFIAASMAGIGLPGFANFWGELGVFTSLATLSIGKILLVICGIVISAIYGLRAVAAIFFGAEPQARRDAPVSGDITWAERLVVLLLLTASVSVGFWPRLLGDAVNERLSTSLAVPATAGQDGVLAPAISLEKQPF
jgi:NADH-quinone oxidoreductase subunit M